MSFSSFFQHNTTSSRKGGSFFTRLSTYLLPPRCTVCAIPLSTDTHRSGIQNSPPLCTSCSTLLAPRKGGYCPRCGELYASEHIPTSLCSTCITSPPPWKRLTFVGAYEHALRQCILEYKFYGRLELAPLLGTMLATKLSSQYCFSPEHRQSLPVSPDTTTQSATANEHAQEPLSKNPNVLATMPDVIVPVPLHPHRLMERGYNQSTEFARYTAKHLKIPIANNMLQRSKATIPQAGLDKKRRLRNLKNCFSTSDSSLISGKHILLVDDIMTTGATLEQTTFALLSQGALQVDIAVIARTPAPKLLSP